MVTTPLLALHDLGVTVRVAAGQRGTILRGASLEVAEGEVVAIIGPSGGGKSTLLKAILGLVPFTQGAIAFRGDPIKRPLDANHRRLRAAAEAVFQNPLAALNPNRSLRATIAEPLRARRTAPTDCNALVENTAKRMGLTPDMLDRRPSAVSLGQAQRACIARALAPEPTLLVLDEPLSALDALVAADVAGLLKEVIAERQPTVLFVSHDMRLVRRLATRVVVVEAGEIVEDALADHLLEAPKSAAARALVGSDRRRQTAFTAAREVARARAITESTL
ncbi:MAG: dipeptide/oligopeptide/nickel ABC transporter ATP-binding protein [Pseudomonadota bacterium]